jgi:amino acid permease
MYLVLTTVGIGYMSLSYQIHEASYVGTLIAIIMSIFINYYSSKLIIVAHNRYPTANSYGELVHLIIGPRAGLVANVILIWYRLSVSTYYINNASRFAWYGLSRLLGFTAGREVVDLVIKFLVALAALLLIVRNRMDRGKYWIAIAFGCFGLFMAAMCVQLPERVRALPPTENYNLISVPTLNWFLTLSTCLFSFVHQSTLVFIMRVFERKVPLEVKVGVD